MKTLKQVLIESFASVYILSEKDKRFIASFGSPRKPLSLAEFLAFWETLDDVERAEILLDYEPERHIDMRGFKE